MQAYVALLYPKQREPVNQTLRDLLACAAEAPGEPLPSLLPRLVSSLLMASLAPPSTATGTDTTFVALCTGSVSVWVCGGGKGGKGCDVRILWLWVCPGETPSLIKGAMLYLLICGACCQWVYPLEGSMVAMQRCTHSDVNNRNLAYDNSRQTTDVLFMCHSQRLLRMRHQQTNPGCCT